MLGIEPTNARKLANERGIRTDHRLLRRRGRASRSTAEHGPAKIVTAANVFAHIEDIHAIVEAIASMLADRGIFISESHYLLALLETLQYDTIYHEHLRYYSTREPAVPARLHGLEVFHAQQHPDARRLDPRLRGAARTQPIQPSVAADLARSRRRFGPGPTCAEFRQQVVAVEARICNDRARDIEAGRRAVYGIGAPSRASTLINYVGLDDGILDYVLEVSSSHGRSASTSPAR